MNSQLKEKEYSSFSEILRECQRRLNIYGYLELEKTTEKEYILISILADKISERVKSVSEYHWKKDKITLRGKIYSPKNISILSYVNTELCYILQDGYKIGQLLGN